MADTANLSKAELIQYEIDKRKLFRTTIAIAATYGVIALVLLIIAMMDTNGVSTLSTDFLPFTVTLIGGMLVILVIMVIQVTTFKPVKAKQAEAPMVCPDYWLLSETDTKLDVDYAAAPQEAKARMRYKCIPDPAVFDSSDTNTYNQFGSTTVNSGKLLDNKTPYKARVKLVSSNSAKPNSPETKLVEAAKEMNNSGFSTTAGASTLTQAGNADITKRNVRCDTVYPEYMAAKDVEFFPEVPNAMRCKYSEVCGVPWSGVCPSKN
jgi:hypothetical protein